MEREVVGEMAREPKPQWPGGDKVPCEYPVDGKGRKAFQAALRAMNSSGIPYSVGGAFALHWYSGFWRVAKDLDLFVLPEHVGWGMGVLEAAGFTTRIRHAQWLAQGLLEEHQVDLVFGMGNWLEYVDRRYVHDARPAIILGVRSKVAPPEELIYSKSFVASRERYDAADVFHLLVAMRGKLDWQRILGRFGEHWEVLLSHLVMFQYVYPSHRRFIPPVVLDELLARFHRTRREPWTGGKLCRGFLLDGIGTYSLDVREWGYSDAREQAWEELQRKRRGVSAA